MFNRILLADIHIHYISESLSPATKPALSFTLLEYRFVGSTRQEKEKIVGEILNNIISPNQDKLPGPKVIWACTLWFPVLTDAHSAEYY
jgi:hypothetical protein